jgi:RNA polymerase sigma-70 factor (ECF subfamily)
VSASDRDLVRRCLEGNEAAFRELHYRHVDRVYRIVGRILGPGGDVPDAVQEVFLEVHRSLERFRGQAAFTTWLHRIAVHVAVTALRRRIRARRPEVLGARPTALDPGGRIDAREEVRTLYAALDELPAKNRVAFVLFELEGLSLEEIAETLAVPLHTAAARVRRARVALVRALSAVERSRPRVEEA